MQSVCVIGSAGMAGQAFCEFLIANNFQVFAVSRVGPDFGFDALAPHSFAKLESFLDNIQPSIVINCLAVTSIYYCEEYPLDSFKVNSLFPKFLAEVCIRINSKLIHISSDHFFDDSCILHPESSAVTPLNHYSVTKLSAERFVLTNPEALVIRTNIVGFRGSPGRPTFVEWLIDSLTNRSPLNLFTDFYTSPIDVETFVRLCTHPSLLSSSGIYNIASSSQISKLEFSKLLARELDIQLDWHNESSVLNLNPRRPRFLGLDCNKIESLLQTTMPSPSQVVANLVVQYKTRSLI